MTPNESIGEIATTEAEEVTSQVQSQKNVLFRANTFFLQIKYWPSGALVLYCRLEARVPARKKDQKRDEEMEPR